MEKNIAIEADNLSFAYNGETVINNISFQVPEGSLTTIIGPNGSGKTTLLKLLIGIIKSQTGSVRIFGKKPREVRAAIGYVPQRFQFDKTFPITVREFFRLTCNTCSADRVDEQLHNFGIQRVLNAMLGELSGGQFQRVLVARAVLHDPKILFFDEPVSGIDVEGEQNFYKLVSHLHKARKLTVVLVSHELHIVPALADQVICINRSLICSGPPAAALTPEVIKKLYGEDITAYQHSCLT